MTDETHALHNPPPKMPMAVKILALTAVAHYLGTDLATERRRCEKGEEGALKFQWVCVHGGDHIVSTSDGHVWAVNYWCDEVTHLGLAQLEV